MSKASGVLAWLSRFRFGRPESLLGWLLRCDPCWNIRYFAVTLVHGDAEARDPAELAKTVAAYMKALRDLNVDRVHAMWAVEGGLERTRGRRLERRVAEGGKKTRGK